MPSTLCQRCRMPVRELCKAGMTCMKALWRFLEGRHETGMSVTFASSWSSDIHFSVHSSSTRVHVDSSVGNLLPLNSWWFLP